MAVEQPAARTLGWLTRPIVTERDSAAERNLHFFVGLATGLVLGFVVAWWLV